MLQVRELGFAYEDERVLQDISLDLSPGEAVCVLGPNGCGKTTLSFCSCGVIPHVIRGLLSGQVLMCGLDTRATDFEDLVARFGYLFQDPDSQFVSLRVDQEIGFVLRNLGVSDGEVKKRVADIAEKLSLSHLLHKSAEALSMGEKQKVALASALVTRPSMIILDEPASTLDYHGQEQFLSALEEARRYVDLVLVFTHRLEYARRLATRVIGMSKGGIAMDVPGMAGPAQCAQLYGVAEDVVAQFSSSGMQQIAAAQCRQSALAQGIDETLLIASDLHFRYPGAQSPCIQNLSLHVRRREILGLVGRNGSGKSTLLGLLAGLYRAKRGRVTLDGQRVDRLGPHERARRVGILFQNPNHQIFSSTIFDELAFGLRQIGLAGPEIEDRLHWAADRFSLPLDDRDPRSLSYGTRKLLALAAVSAMKPEVLLLDEPELGLDLHAREQFRCLLQELNSRHGVSIVIATHDLALLDGLADRIALIADGAVRVEGSTNHIFRAAAEYLRGKDA